MIYYEKISNDFYCARFFTTHTVGFTVKQNSDLTKAESALFEVGISYLVIDYQTCFLAEALNELTQEKLLTIYQDGSSLIERDFQKLYTTYRELSQYYVAMNGTDDQVGSHLQEI